MERLRCRPIMHITVNRPQHMNTSPIWRERRRKGREKEESRSPHELHHVGDKLTELVAQPCSILCTANHDFKISTSECIRYPPKCAFSRLNNEKFSGEGHSPLPQQGGETDSLHPTLLGAFGASILAPSALCHLVPPQTSKRNENWYPPLFGTKLRPWLTQL